MKKLNRKNTNLPINKPAKVLQFGGGNFLRAFTNWMIDELNQQTNFNGGVIIVKPTEKGDYMALREQDGLFHVLTNGIKNDELITDTQLIECVQEIIHPYLAWASYLKSAETPTLRFIISNTTEAGIQFNPEDTFGDYSPKEFPGKLTRWLFHRWQYFKGSAESGCIILPSELIEGNGQQLKNCIVQYANLWNLADDFNDWIDQHNHFCNTLVDRIVPGFPMDSIDAVYQNIGYEDELVVVAEPYHIWVIEGNKTIQSELPFDQTNLNVVFTNDLAPYRQLKVRILNGAHTTMVPTGYLAGIETVREAVEDERMGAFIKNALFEEILPTLDFPQAQLEKYANDVLDRFKNPFIKHQLISISLNSIAKYKTRVLPTLLAYVEQKKELPKNLVIGLAALICFYSGKRDNESIALRDNEMVLSFFKNAWQEWEISNKNTKKLVKTILQDNTIWGQDLSTIPKMTETLTKAVNLQIGGNAI